MSDSLLDTLQSEEEYRPAHPKPEKRERSKPKRIGPKSGNESTALEDTADGLLYRLLLRRANHRCEAVGLGVGPDGELIRCGGRLDPAHGWSRRHHGVRWAAANVWLLCRNHHDFYTARSVAWRAFRILKLGMSLYERVKELANATWRGDVREVIAELRAGRTQLERAA